MHSFELLTALLICLASVGFQGVEGAVSFSPRPAGWSANSKFQVKGSSGVSAMQLAVTTQKKLIFIDRVENNPLKVNGKPVWGAEMDIASGKLRALPMVTNSFCAAGSWMKDGTLVSLGGDANTQFGARNGLQGVRFFKPCDNGKCQITENPNSQKLTRPRWYPSSCRLQDGSILIMGGVSETTYMTPENTIEFWPKKNGVRASAFLRASLKDNLFPHNILLPDGRVFVGANNMAMIYDWQKNQEQRLPNFPNNLRVTYPYGSGAVLLPLKSSNGYTPEVIFCSGTNLPQGQFAGKEYQATNRCFRMVVNASGISRGWQSEESPDGRIMSNMVIMPDGNLVWINGAGSGAAGYYNDRLSDGSFSSADNPRRTPYLYQPDLPAGRRWSQIGATAKVNRMYHSVASLLPDGRVLTSGSNPTPYVDQSKQNKYPTEYRNEYLIPPYMNGARPSFAGLPSKIGYKGKFTLRLTIPSGLSGEIKVTLHDLGFSTHGVDYNRRAVFLDFTRSGNSLTVTGPPSTGVYPPGPGFVFVTINGIPAAGQKTLVG